MTKKYKVNEVAKDLQVENKEVIEVLKELGGEPKKATTALTEEELDIVFDHVTQKNSVENFDAYFAQKDSGESVEQPAEPKSGKGKTCIQGFHKKPMSPQRKSPGTRQLGSLRRQKTQSQLRLRREHNNQRRLPSLLVSQSRAIVRLKTAAMTMRFKNQQAGL